MHALTAPPDITPADRLGLTVFFAVAAHAIVILGVTFVPEDRPRSDLRSLDVVLVQHVSERPPEEAEYLAQASQDGGGESDATERPATPLPTPLIGPEPDIAVASAPAPPVEPVLAETPEPPAPAAEPPPPPAPPAPAPKPVLAQVEQPAPQKVEVARDPPPEEAPAPVEQTPAPAPEKKQKRFAESKLARVEEVPEKAEPRESPAAAATQTIDAAALVSRSLALASLSAEIDERMRAYAKRPRRKWITARTREHKYAAYMEAWRRKVERIGNINYPDDARRERLSGSLLLDVALNADGSVNEILLRRSSGHRALDDAAVRIVRLAAPFAKLPDSILEDTDILHIERTWQFLSSNRFASR